MKVKKAIILSAGFGKRLHPITLNKPKPLLKINNKTLLENAIHVLEKFGIEERCDGVKIKALYHRDNKIIYLHEDWNEYNLLDRSFLLHELVHHRQKEAEYMCRQEMEHEAYELQFKFLKENAINNPQEILDINDVFYVILTTCAAVE